MFPPPEPPRGPYRAVLFDVDGTLIDTAELIADSIAYACRRHLGREHPRDTYYALIGRPAIAQMEALGGDRAPEMVDTALEYYDRHSDQERPFPGALDTLAILSEAGIALGLVTSKLRRELAPSLERWGLHRWVRTVVTSELTTRPKPEPDPVYYALQALQIGAAETLFIGDSPYDLQSGRTAGVRTGAVTWGPHPRAALAAERPDYTFETFKQIRSLCNP